MQIEMVAAIMKHVVFVVVYVDEAWSGCFYIFSFCRWKPHDLYKQNKTKKTIADEIETVLSR